MNSGAIPPEAGDIKPGREPLLPPLLTAEQRPRPAQAWGRTRVPPLFARARERDAEEAEPNQLPAQHAPSDVVQERPAFAPPEEGDATGASDPDDAVQYRIDQEGVANSGALPASGGRSLVVGDETPEEDEADEVDPLESPLPGEAVSQEWEAASESPGGAGDSDHARPGSYPVLAEWETGPSDHREDADVADHAAEETVAGDYWPEVEGSFGAAAKEAVGPDAVEPSQTWAEAERYPLDDSGTLAAEDVATPFGAAPEGEYLTAGVAAGDIDAADAFGAEPAAADAPVWADDSSASASVWNGPAEPAGAFVGDSPEVELQDVAAVWGEEATVPGEDGEWPEAELGDSLAVWGENAAEPRESVERTVAALPEPVGKHATPIAAEAYSPSPPEAERLAVAGDMDFGTSNFEFADPAGAAVEVAAGETDSDASDPAPAPDGALGPAEEWRDEQPGAPLGEAEPEDEAPLMAAAGRAVVEAFTGALGAARAGSEPHFHFVAGAEDPQRVREVAERLERIAQTLREHGPTGPMLEQATDPLGALITGYLLGYFEGNALHPPPASG